MIKYQRRYLDDRQKLQRWTDPRLCSVRVGQIQAYLLAKGWKEVPPDRPGFRVFQEPSANADEPLYQFVPESEDWDGYASQVYDLVAALAEIEDRYAGEVLTEILQQPPTSQVNGTQRSQEQRAGMLS